MIKTLGGNIMCTNQIKESQNVSTYNPELKRAAEEAVNSLGISNGSDGYNYLVTAAEVLASKQRT